MKDRVNGLSDFERKVLTIIYHHNKRGHITSITELQLRTGRRKEDIKKTIDDLIAKDLLAIEGKEMIAKIKLF